MFRLFNNLRRAIYILLVLYKYDLLFWLLANTQLPKILLCCVKRNKKHVLPVGDRFCTALEDLGPIFIKLGQTLSTRADFLGEEICNSLSRLQDKLPPFASDVAINIIEAELGGKLSEFFTEFQVASVAAASISQVHTAVTISGKQVAVKILRPGIEAAFATDLELFFQLAKFLAKRVSSARRLKPVEVVTNFANIVKLELDLRIEAASASQLKANCLNDKDLFIPEVNWQLTTQKILTIEWVDGTSIADIAKLKELGHDLEKLAGNLAVIMLNQAYRDGFFHADMHPGNILVNEAGKIVLLDFGIMGHLDRHTRIYVAQILKGFLNRDYVTVAKIHFTAGYVKNHHQLEQFALACRAIGEPIFGCSANKISIAKLLAQLFKVTEDFEMETRQELLLLQKTMMLVEGVGSKLCPEVNLWQLAAPWIEDWAKRNLSLDAKMLNFVLETLPNLITTRLEKSPDQPLAICCCQKMPRLAHIAVVILLVYLILNS